VGKKWAWLLGIIVVATACTGTDPVPAGNPSSTTTGAESGRGPAGTLDAAAAGLGDEYFPELGNPGYDVLHYTLDLVFDPEQTRLAGVATITATSKEALGTFNLDFTGLTINSITVDGAPAEFAAVSQDVTIRPQVAIAAGADFVVEVDYAGTPSSTRSTALPFGIGWTTSNGQNYVVAEPNGAHSWFPSNDHPLDKATYTFRITVPDGTVAAANGTLVDQVAGQGQRTWTWEMRSPMAAYLATLVIGDFAIVEDTPGSTLAAVPIRHVLPAGTTIEDWPGLERLGEMIVFLEDLFGPYPFDNYGIAIVDGFGAALENQTLSLFDGNIARSAFFEDVLVHELAHQWFGNSVSVGMWKDIWLSEGFASYAEWLWLEREQGAAALADGIESERLQFAGSGLNPPGRPPSFDLFNSSVYRVGAMTLHALRLTVGDDNFFEILRTYASRFADAAVTTREFVAVAEEVSGTQLDDLFDAWLTEFAVPEFP